jgi:pimeloyl-ACP methyl ester carboxylesterase
MKHPIVEHTLELGGARTRVLELDGEGPPILLLHGFADSADTWRLVLDRLRREERAAVALDMPGFGRASRLDREQLILPQLDRFVTDAVSHYANARGILVAGNSLGGCMALRVAENAVLPIEGVIPIAPAGLDMATWIRIIEAAPLGRALLASPVPVPEPVVRQVVGRLYSLFAFTHPRRVDPGVVRAFTSHIPSRRDARRMLATGRAVAAELADPFQLQGIHCPVLLVWGDRDRMVYPTGAERVLAEVAGARLETIEDCGHCPQIEAPDRLSELLLGFPGEATGAGAPRGSSSVSG